VGTDRKKIVAEAKRLLSDPSAKAEMSGENPYGDGKSARRIVNFLYHHEKEVIERTIDSGFYPKKGNHDKS
jgi:UDP-N-acetylglucosamine 2-epimerase